MKHTTAPFTLRCLDTGDTYDPSEVRYRSDHGALLEVVHELDALDPDTLRATWDERLGGLGGVDRSGVWRYRELVIPVEPTAAITMNEGSTPLYCSEKLSAYTGVEALTLKHEGQNPTGSFKDRGMVAGITAARLLGQTAVACASTGNTSASLAAYASAANMRGLVFIPAGGIALGKLAQALAYDASVIQIDGNFDDAMRLVQEVCAQHAVYLLNSINPFRIEGQKTIGFEILHELRWNVPDWIVVPGGNLGNSSAIFKGLAELLAIGVIDRMPRFAVCQAAGAAPLYHGYLDDFAGPARTVERPETLATAIKIGSPVSWPKCVKAIRESRGVVTSVTDDEIMHAKRAVDGAGIGAEPASCASVAGLRKLVNEGVIKQHERCTCVLTGHVLKDPDAVLREHAPGGAIDGLPVCAPTLDGVSEAVARAIEGGG
ncbi:MAG: threonine synthase [Phycisphaerales bacterium]